MNIFSTLISIHTLLKKAVADFHEHKNVNTLCEQVRNGLFELMEEFLPSIIEKVLCDPELLPVLKAGAGRKGLRFNGCRSTSIRLFTGKALKIQYPYFAKS